MRKGGEEGERMKRLDGITDSLDMSLSKLRQLKTGKPGMLQFMGLQRVRHDLEIEQKHVLLDS